MLENILFYVVFISQLGLISIYLPNRILARVRTVMERYPPEDYPKLYPRSVEFEYRGQQNFRLLNRLIAFVGVVLLGFMVEWEIRVEGVQEYSVATPAFYGLLQFVPFALLEFTGFQQFKLMRQADTRTLRFAELQPRRLFDFVSPVLVVATVTILMGYFVVELTGAYLEMWETRDTIVRCLSAILCNILFAVIIAWNLHGRKPDPYQASKDRYANVAAVIKVQLLISMAVSIYFTVNTLLNYLDWPKMELLANSLYFQVIAAMAIGTMLNGVKVEHIDFDVYKKDVSAEST